MTLIILLIYKNYLYFINNRKKTTKLLNYFLSNNKQKSYIKLKELLQIFIGVKNLKSESKYCLNSDKKIIKEYLRKNLTKQIVN